jgi:nitric-oxide synthase
MVGAGTGIAPFRSLWQERRFLTDNVPSNYGDMVLYFGCRSNIDELYRSEVDVLVNESVIRAYHVAYSRFFEMKKAYVQDKMIENSVEIFDLIYRQKAHFYICGDVRMAADVTQTLETIISKQGALNPTEAKEFLVRLKVKKKIF